MSILNVNQIQPVGSGQTVTISAANITASSSTITASSFVGSSGLNVTSGSVGIGTDNPRQKLTFGSLTASDTSTPDCIDLGATYSGTNASNLKLKLYTDGSAEFGFGASVNSRLDYVVPSNGNHVFYRGTTESCRINTSGNLAFPSGNGIDFSAASGSAAGSTSAILDDYEEGTFTGTIQNSNDSDTGYYVKIGNRVFWQIDINPITGSTATGQPTLTGLPFTSSSSKETVVGKVASGNAFTWSGYLVPWIGPSSTTYSFWGITSNTGWAAAGFVNGDVGTIRVSGDYFVD